MRNSRFDCLFLRLGALTQPECKQCTIQELTVSAETKGHSYDGDEAV